MSNNKWPECHHGEPEPSRQRPPKIKRPPKWRFTHLQTSFITGWKEKKNEAVPRCLHKQDYWCDTSARKHPCIKALVRLYSIPCVSLFWYCLFFWNMFPYSFWEPGKMQALAVMRECFYRHTTELNSLMFNIRLLNLLQYKPSTTSKKWKQKTKTSFVYEKKLKNCHLTWNVYNRRHFTILLRKTKHTKKGMTTSCP